MKVKYDIPARYVYAAVTILGSFLLTVQRSSMNVAITGMVKTKSSANSNNTFVNTDVCPISNDTTTSITSQKEGEFDWDEVTQGYILTGPVYGVVCTILIGVHFTRGWSPKKVIAIINISSSILHVLTPVVARWNVTALIILRALQGLITGSALADVARLQARIFAAPRQYNRPLFLKAFDIVANATDDSNIAEMIVRLGGFHLLMNFLECCGKFMEGSGIEDLWSNVYGKATITHLISGHAFARTYRASGVF
uniref:Uncharacterized protein n=1 Tax=Timema bartmani TaxID=61472 RepID=A0A7R9FC18_9NEOP|nr:unnamed protein product [Timema bartmani]